MSARCKLSKWMSARRKEGTMIDLSQIAEQEWDEAHRRAEIVRPLLDFGV